MNKEHILELLRAAKSAHLYGVKKVKYLIGGKNVKADELSLNCRECKFGKWFFGDAQLLKSLSNNPVESMMKIERLHFNLYDIYNGIFSIYFTKPKIGVFAKLFGKKNTLNDSELSEVNAYHSSLELISKELLEEVNRLERRLLAVPEEKIRQLV